MNVPAPDNQPRKHTLCPAEGIALFALFGWAVTAVVLVRAARKYRWLHEFDPAADLDCPPVSIVVPACNEADTVEPAMRSLLALDYPDLEIIAIDDRSTDETASVLERLAATDARLKKRAVTTLPPGWLGKNHALQLGADEARGAFVLFTDADVIYQPDALRRAMTIVNLKIADHLTIAPRLVLKTFVEKLLISYFFAMFSVNFRPWEVEDPDTRGYVGIGAFNLVRKSAYQAMGGHRSLPMEVADDVKLGKLLKRAGYREVYVLGGDSIRVRWVSGLSGFVHGLTKNMFAGIEYRWDRLLAITTLFAASHVYPGFGFFVGSRLTKVLCLGTLGCMALCAHPPGSSWIAHGRRLPGESEGPVESPPTESPDFDLTQTPGQTDPDRNDPGFVYGLGYPLAAIIWLFTLWRSAITAELNGGITWRGTLYPLDELRRNVV